MKKYAFFCFLIVFGVSSAAFGQTSAVFNAKLYVGNGITMWGTGDIGSQINNAYASSSCPSTGCVIHVITGQYSFSTTIIGTHGVSGKPVLIECDPGTGTNFANSGHTTQLTYTGSGTAVNISIGTTGSGMVGCGLYGPGTATATIGLLVGGSSSSNGTGVLQHFDYNDIANFGTGLEFGYNVYVTHFEGNDIHDNGTATLGHNVYMPSGVTGTGENIHFHGGAITNKSSFFSTSCLEIDNPTDISFSNISFDQCGATFNAVNVFANLTDNHWENPNGATASPFLTVGPASNFVTLNIRDKEWLEDTAGTGRTEFIKIAPNGPNAGITVNIEGGVFVPAENVQQLLNSTGAGCCAVATVSGIENGFGGSVFTNLVGGSWFEIWAPRLKASGTVALAGGGATVSGISPQFSNGSSFNCIGNDLTTGTNPVKVFPASPSSITVVGIGSDTISYICSGH